MCTALGVLPVSTVCVCVSVTWCLYKPGLALCEPPPSLEGSIARKALFLFDWAFPLA